ncbi:hypothetical protein TTHERM_00266750 (macronuclear) [Tetrahymena thermophila SB210]|uniref:Transmembrane protein n=1 Tax=Tetrahymena thermophila (strain SB210) TaxID=312017 RepID=I7M7Q8_TETTS|nr:hypothetical protein TTHERM_00266750 [Tetrahymena thermophila SB210]EAR95664.1 hypothetical protein TTHERM_00266750 [Tetrahymena thermophila SB210]|eukprot:XP_001015909.1 hypothetical protein TTHERM_00266750 [Tetrahymena thermophila SB210]
MKLNFQVIILSTLVLQLSYGQGQLSICSGIQGYLSCVNTEGCELVKQPEMQCDGSCLFYKQDQCSNSNICQWTGQNCINTTSCTTFKSESDCNASQVCKWDNIYVCQDIKNHNTSSSSAVICLLLSYFLVYLAF